MEFCKTSWHDGRLTVENILWSLFLRLRVPNKHHSFWIIRCFLVVVVGHKKQFRELSRPVEAGDAAILGPLLMEEATRDRQSTTFLLLSIQVFCESSVISEDFRRFIQIDGSFNDPWSTIKEYPEVFSHHDLQLLLFTQLSPLRFGRLDGFFSWLVLWCLSRLHHLNHRKTSLIGGSLGTLWQGLGYLSVGRRWWSIREWRSFTFLIAITIIIRQNWRTEKLKNREIEEPRNWRSQ